MLPGIPFIRHVSSAKDDSREWKMLLSVSWIIIRKRSGPSTDPWGTPEIASVTSDKVQLTDTLCNLPVRKDFIQSSSLPLIPVLLILFSRIV